MINSINSLPIRVTKKMEAFQAFLMEIKEMQDSIKQLKGDFGSYKNENQVMNASITRIFEELAQVKAGNIAIRKHEETAQCTHEKDEETMERVQIRGRDETVEDGVKLIQCENGIMEASQTVECKEVIEAMHHNGETCEELSECKDDMDKKLTEDLQGQNEIEKGNESVETVRPEDEDSIKEPIQEVVHDDEQQEKSVQCQGTTVKLEVTMPPNCEIEGESAEAIQLWSGTEEEEFETFISDEKKEESGEVELNEDRIRQAGECKNEETVGLEGKTTQGFTEESVFVDDEAKEQSVEYSHKMDETERESETDCIMQCERKQEKDVEVPMVPNKDLTEEKSVESVQDKAEKKSTEVISIKEETTEELSEPVLCINEAIGELTETLQHDGETEVGSEQQNDEIEKKSTESALFECKDVKEILDEVQCKDDTKEEPMHCKYVKDTNSDESLCGVSDDTENDIAEALQCEEKEAEPSQCEIKEEMIQCMDGMKNETTESVGHVDDIGTASVEPSQLKKKSKKEYVKKVQFADESDLVEEVQFRNGAIDSVHCEDEEGGCLLETESKQHIYEADKEIIAFSRCEYEKEDLLQNKDGIKEQSLEALQCEDSTEETNETERQSMDAMHAEEPMEAIEFKDEKVKEPVRAAVSENEQIYLTVEASQCEDETAETTETSQDDDVQENSTHASDQLKQYGDQIIAFDKKVKKACSKVRRSVKGFKKEFHREMVRVQEDSHKVAQLQRVFNIMHISFMTKKESEEEKQTEASSASLPVLPTIPLKHPSSVGISRSEAKKLLENIKKAAFCVMLKEIPLLCHVAVCIDEYTKIEKHCEYMDSKTGIYTVPLPGRYEFRIGRATGSYKVEIFLCIDRDTKRVDVSSNSQETNGYYHRIVFVDCEVNDHIWLEASGRQQGYNDVLSQVVFRGKKMM